MTLTKASPIAQYTGTTNGNLSRALSAKLIDGNRPYIPISHLRRTNFYLRFSSGNPGIRLGSPRSLSAKAFASSQEEERPIGITLCEMAPFAYRALVSEFQRICQLSSSKL